MFAWSSAATNRPDRKEFTKVAVGTAIGFVVMLRAPKPARARPTASATAAELTPMAVRVNKAHRRMAVLDNEEEGEKYAEHGLRKYLRTRRPEVMPTINHFFSHSQEDK
ncbi:hypothetical protein ACLB2K_058205 [Fragaria x ananassa]